MLPGVAKCTAPKHDHDYDNSDQDDQDGNVGGWGGDDVKELNLPSLLISPVSEYIDSKEMVCRKSDCRRESLGSRVSATCKVEVMSGIKVSSEVYI